MKYFMAVYSAGRGYDRYFQMDEKTARHYYYEYLGNMGKRDKHIEWAFEAGTHVHAPKPFASGLRIYGEEMTDKELFRLRIKGEIEKEML